MRPKRKIRALVEGVGLRVYPSEESMLVHAKARGHVVVTTAGTATGGVYETKPA